MVTELVSTAELAFDASSLTRRRFPFGRSRKLLAGEEEVADRDD